MTLLLTVKPKSRKERVRIGNREYLIREIKKIKKGFYFLTANGWRVELYPAHIKTVKK